ncbi:MAG: acyl-CoA dehydrogenase family protein [Desulfovibrionaceae bacterium]
MYTLQTLPGDDVRQIMWRFSERFDLQMVVQSARQVARGTAASLVAQGARKTHEWTDLKAQLLDAFDASGLTSLFMDPHQGGFIEGPKNLALALVAYELAWVDGGAATCALASNLALAPIHEKGTPEQRDFYMSRAVPPQPGEDREIWRGAFALTEPLPYVGVDTGVLVGKVRVADWPEGGEPMLEVEKRGRFITNMDFAVFVTAAVDTDDPRIKTSCMITLQADDPGAFDRGAPTLKMCHQLSSTRDPVLRLTVPASRIIGGYDVVDGVIVPRFTHGEIIGAVFHRTRIPVGLMTTAHLLSAIEPVIRYHRGRFRGGKASTPGSPKFEQGIQQKEDAQQRLVDIFAMGEAGASLGFGASRLGDEADTTEKLRAARFAEQGVIGPRKQMAATRKRMAEILEYVELSYRPEAERGPRFAELDADPVVKCASLDALGNIVIPATKLWNTGQGANMLREAISLMGGYGITEDCPGFLMNKWADSQLEATYEGPEAVQRLHLTVTMNDEVFLAHLRQWIAEMQRIAAERPGKGACTMAAALELWYWTLDWLQQAKDVEGKALWHRKRQGVTFPMADALCWLLGARQLILDTVELEDKGPMNPVVAEGLPGLAPFYSDLCQWQAARSAGECARILTELVYGFLAHPDCGESACTGAGPVACEAEGLEAFTAIKTRLDGAMAGCRLARDRAGLALTQVMIPEALDYPL